jgi:REP element-mobilizing transposase RayT
LFGSVVSGKVKLSRIGQIVEDEWLRTPVIRPRVGLDEFILMPDHFHAIVSLGENCWTQQEPLIRARPKRSLGSLIAGFKSVSTVRVNRIRGTPGRRVWQKNYYEHVVRNQEDLERIRDYIRRNPARWG